MEYVKLHDRLAAFVVVALVVGIGICVGLGRPVPEYYINVFVAAVGWTLRGGAQAMNEFSHRKREGTDDATGD